MKLYLFLYTLRREVHCTRFTFVTVSGLTNRLMRHQALQSVRNGHDSCYGNRHSTAVPPCHVLALPRANPTKLPISRSAELALRLFELKLKQPPPLPPPPPPPYPSGFLRSLLLSPKSQVGFRIADPYRPPLCKLRKISAPVASLGACSSDRRGFRSEGSVVEYLYLFVVARFL